MEHILFQFAPSCTNVSARLFPSVVRSHIYASLYEEVNHHAPENSSFFSFSL